VQELRESKTRAAAKLSRLIVVVAVIVDTAEAKCLWCAPSALVERSDESIFDLILFNCLGKKTTDIIIFIANDYLFSFSTAAIRGQSLNPKPLPAPDLQKLCL